LSSGPFTMMPGDTQNVVAALVIGRCGDRLSSISHMRFEDQFAKVAFNSDFDLTPPPPQPKVTVATAHDSVTLCWDSASRFNYNVPNYQFEGYNIYQGESSSGPWHRIATYDVPDTFLVIFDQIFDPGTCQILPQYPVAFGTNTGI